MSPATCRSFSWILVRRSSSISSSWTMRWRRIQARAWAPESRFRFARTGGFYRCRRAGPRPWTRPHYNLRRQLEEAPMHRVVLALLALVVLRDDAPKPPVEKPR